MLSLRLCTLPRARGLTSAVPLTRVPFSPTGQAPLVWAVEEPTHLYLCFPLASPQALFQGLPVIFSLPRRDRSFPVVAKRFKTKQQTIWSPAPNNLPVDSVFHAAHPSALPSPVSPSLPLHYKSSSSPEGCVYCKALPDAPPDSTALPCALTALDPTGPDPRWLTSLCLGLSFVVCVHLCPPLPCDLWVSGTPRARCRGNLNTEMNRAAYTVTR